jgi:hypothetical protein
MLAMVDKQTGQQIDANQEKALARLAKAEARAQAKAVLEAEAEREAAEAAKAARIRKMNVAKRLKADQAKAARTARVGDMLHSVDQLMRRETITVDEVFEILARIVEDQQAGREAEAIGYVRGLAFAREREVFFFREQERRKQTREEAALLGQQEQDEQDNED